MMIGGIPAEFHRTLVERWTTVFEGREGVALGELPLGPCVYFLILFGKIQYVGKAKNLPQRILSHRRSKKIKFDRVLFLPVGTRDLVSEEKTWIRAFNPPANRTDVKPHILARRGRKFTKHRRRRKITKATW